jgi:predicted Zn-dependent protease
LAESYNQKGERTLAVGVLTDAAAQFSQGRFPATAVELIQRIIQGDRNASALRAVADTCLKYGEPKHLVAAVCLLGMAHEHDPTDRQALELLARAFERMGLGEKARRVEAFIAEIFEEAPSLSTIAL